MRFLLLVALTLGLAGFHCGPDTIDLYGMPEPPQAARAWALARACADVPVQPGGDLKDVHWMVADLSLINTHLLGVWMPPDTILLDRYHVTDTLTIEHELLHQLLRGSVNGEAHPFVPFVWPCRV